MGHHGAPGHPPCPSTDITERPRPRLGLWDAERWAVTAQLVAGGWSGGQVTDRGCMRLQGAGRPGPWSHAHPHPAPGLQEYESFPQGTPALRGGYEPLLLFPGSSHLARVLSPSVPPSSLLANSERQGGTLWALGIPLGQEQHRRPREAVIGALAGPGESGGSVWGGAPPSPRSPPRPHHEHRTTPHPTSRPLVPAIYSQCLDMTTPGTM